MNYLNPFHEKFILKDVLKFLGNLLDYLNPFSENFILLKLWDFLDDYISMFETVQQVQSGQNISVGLNNYNFGNGLTYNNDKFIDFGWITKYKNTWYAWARGIIFVLLIIYNINQIMKLFRGYNVGEGISSIGDKSSHGGDSK